MALQEILRPLVPSAADPDMTRLQFWIAACNFKMSDYKTSEEQLRALLPAYEKNEGKHFDEQELEDVDLIFVNVLLSLE